MTAAVYNADEVAALLGVTRARVYALARLGLVPHLRMGRQLRFPVTAFERWLADGGTSLPGGWKAEAA